MLKPMCRHDEIRDTLIYLANNPIPELREVIAPFCTNKGEARIRNRDVWRLWWLAHDLANVLRAVNGGE